MIKPGLIPYEKTTLSIGHFSNDFLLYQNSDGFCILTDSRFNYVMQIKHGLFVFLPSRNLFLIGKDGQGKNHNKNMLLNFCTLEGVILYKEWIREIDFYAIHFFKFSDLEFAETIFPSLAGVQ